MIENDRFHKPNKLDVQFELENGVVVSKLYNDSWTPKSAFYEFARTVLGREPAESINLDELEGKPCRVSICHDETDSGDIWERVDRVLKAREPREAGWFGENPDSIAG